MIGICTDSNSQLPPALRDRFDVEVVPLTVTVDGTDHLEGVDLDADTFYAAFAEGRTPEVATSQPSPGRVAEAYRRLTERGATSIVSIHVTASMSGTLGAATLAAADAPVPVRLVDSGAASFGISCCVWAAALAREAGGSIDDVVGAAERLAPSIGTAFVIGVPLLTRRGGRAAGVDLEGEGIPVLSMSGGELAVLDRVTDLDTAVTAMTAYALAHGGDRAGERYVAVGTSDDTSRPVADALTAALADHPAVADLVPYRIGPSVGVHTGPGTAGLFVFPSARAP